MWDPYVSVPSLEPSSHLLASRRNILFMRPLSLLPSSPPPTTNVPFSLTFSLPMEHRVPAGSRAPRRRLFASAPTGIVPTHLPQIQSSIYRCFLVTGAIILKIIWGVKLLIEQQSEGQDRKYNVWRRH